MDNIPEAPIRDNHGIVRGFSCGEKRIPLPVVGTWLSEQWGTRGRSPRFIPISLLLISRISQGSIRFSKARLRYPGFPSERPDKAVPRQGPLELLNSHLLILEVVLG